MKKVLLIKIADSGFMVSPPLGLLYLSSALKQQGGYETRIVHMRADKLGPTDIAKLTSEYKPDVVGLSAMWVEFPHLLRTATEIRKQAPQQVIIAGGPVVTNAGTKCLESGVIDFGVAGEGERVLPLLLEAIRGKGNIDSIPGLVYRDGNNQIHANPPEPIDNLDELPFPDWEAIDMKKYFKLPRNGVVWSRRAYATIFTSRGCPFRCAYCHHSFGKRFRARSPESVLAEIGIFYNKFGIKEIQIVDDTFNFDKERATSILEGILRAGYDIKLGFPSGLRGDLITNRQIELLGRIGTSRIPFAVETANRRIAEMIRRKQDLDRLREVISLADKHNILTLGLSMMGFPTETVEEMEETAEFLISSKLHSISVTTVIPYPGTDMIQIAREAGCNVDWEPEDYEFYTSRRTLSPIGAKKLRQVIRRTQRRLYLNPWRLKRLWQLIEHPIDVAHQASVLAYRLLPGVQRNWTKDG